MKKIYVTANNIQSPSCEKECQETSINWSRGDKKVTICTSDSTFVTKLKNIMIQNPNDLFCYYYSNNIDKETNCPYSYMFECDLSQLSIRKKTERKPLSIEEKLTIMQRLCKYNN